MPDDEILINEEAFYWFTVGKASELYEQFGEIVLDDIKNNANKCGCKRTGDCCSSFPKP